MSSHRPENPTMLGVSGMGHSKRQRLLTFLANGLRTTEISVCRGQIYKATEQAGEMCCAIGTILATIGGSVATPRYWQNTVTGMIPDNGVPSVSYWEFLEAMGLNADAIVHDNDVLRRSFSEIADKLERGGYDNNQGGP